MDCIKIIFAETPVDIARARALFEEYAASLPISLCFQNFAEELAGLPGNYAAPTGCLLLAEHDSELAGCVALRSMSRQICEMKRLYVRPAFRRFGIGRHLTIALIQEAWRIGYERMRLDTLTTMTEAQSLYASLGFQVISPYGRHPAEGAVCLELNLNDRANRSRTLSDEH